MIQIIFMLINRVGILNILRKLIKRDIYIKDFSRMTLIKQILVFFSGNLNIIGGKAMRNKELFIMSQKMFLPVSKIISVSCYDFFKI